MCCGDEEELGLPPAVIEMLPRYRRMRDEQGWGWGEDALPDFFRPGIAAKPLSRNDVA